MQYAGNKMDFYRYTILREICKRIHHWVGLQYYDKWSQICRSLPGSAVAGGTYSWDNAWSAISIPIRNSRANLLHYVALTSNFEFATNDAKMVYAGLKKRRSLSFLVVCVCLQMWKDSVFVFYIAKMGFIIRTNKNMVLQTRPYRYSCDSIVRIHRDEHKWFCKVYVVIFGIVLVKNRY
jgi:hypothetical protein